MMCFRQCMCACVYSFVFFVCVYVCVFMCLFLHACVWSMSMSVLLLRLIPTAGGDEDSFGLGSPHGSLFSEGGQSAASIAVVKSGGAPKAEDDLPGELTAIIRNMAQATAVLTDMATNSPPIPLLKNSFFGVLVARNSVTLESPEGFSGEQLAGAVAGGESESKGDVEESDTKTAEGKEGGHPFVKVLVADTEALSVSLSSNTKLPSGKGLFVKGTQPGAKETLILPSMGTKSVDIESLHP